MADIVLHEPNSEKALEDTLRTALQNKDTVVLLNNTSDINLTGPLNDKDGVIFVDLTVLEKRIPQGPQYPYQQSYQKTSSLQQTLHKVRESVGKGVPVEEETFENWAKDQQATVLGAYPETKEDVTNLIKAAKTNGLKVRTNGKGHSWSAIVVDDGQLLMHVDKLKSDYPGGANVRHATEGSNQVDVMASASTGDLKQFQLDNKINLPCNVILDVVKMGGIIATGSHGVEWDAHTPGDYVTQMRIFDSDGNLRTYTKDDPTMMRAVSANFGFFGIIYDMRIQLQPGQNVLLNNVYMPAKKVFEDPNAFKQLVESNWSVELFWFPFNNKSLIPLSKYDPFEDDLQIRVINYDTTGHEVESQEFYQTQAKWDFISSAGMKAASPLYTHYPALTPLLCKSAFSVLQRMYEKDKDFYQELPHAVHYRKFIHLSPVRDMEFVFDLNGDYRKMIDVINVVKDIMMKYYDEGKYPLNITMEMRWMAYGKSFMTPATIGNPEYGGSGQSYYIEVLSMNNTPHWQEFCNEIAVKWMEMGGIPHFAKEWEKIPGIFEHIKKKMAKNIEQFKEQLKASKADPGGLFLNDTMNRLLEL